MRAVRTHKLDPATGGGSRSTAAKRREERAARARIGSRFAVLAGVLSFLSAPALWQAWSFLEMTECSGACTRSSLLTVVKSFLLWRLRQPRLALHELVQRQS